MDVNPANAAHQTKTNHRFTVNNTGETTPFDWYNARFNVDFKLQKLADGANIDNQDAMVNSASSLIKRLNVKMNGIDVYDCSEANQATNIKNLLEYSQGYVASQGTNEFFYLDTNRHAENRAAQNNYNRGSGARHLLLGGNATVNAEIPLNRYGFFESLHTELLPNSRIEIKIDLDSDANVTWREGGADSRVVLTKFQLIVPRIVFNAEGKSLYMSRYLDTQKWTYLRELVERGNSTRQQTGTFRISTAINKPRHVFIVIINDVNDNAPTANKFLHNTFAPANQTLTSCYLEVGNGKEYPELHYRPQEEPTRVFRDVLKYVHANNDYAGNTLLNRANFAGIFSFLYFDLTKEPTDIRDGITKLTFKYTLSGATNADYSVYSLVLYEQDVEMRKTDGKLTLRSM